VGWDGRGGGVVAGAAAGGAAISFASFSASAGVMVKLGATSVENRIRGDRRLVLLETAFE